MGLFWWSAAVRQHARKDTFLSLAELNCVDRCWEISDWLLTPYLQKKSWKKSEKSFYNIWISTKKCNIASSFKCTLSQSNAFLRLLFLGGRIVQDNPGLFLDSDPPEIDRNRHVFMLSKAHKLHPSLFIRRIWCFRLFWCVRRADGLLAKHCKKQTDRQSKRFSLV